MLDLDKIRIDGGTQSRAELNQDTVAEYAEAYKAGAEFPPVTVFFDGKHQWLADGFHRYFASKAAGRTTILEKVTPGTQRDAVLFSLSANATHGLRRTNDDKRRAVMTLLNDPEWSGWSDREIARQCGVTHPFVANLRKPKVVTVTTPKAKAAPEPAAEVSVSAPADEVIDSPVEHEERDVADESASFIAELADENETLRARLAVGVMEGTDEEKREAAETITHLRQRVKSLEAEVTALRASRDGFQREASELRKQIKMNEKELKKARAAA